MDKFLLRKAKNLVGFFLLFTATTAFGQVMSVTGTVVDNNGDVLPGASVIVKGTLFGTTTNADGSFTINVPTQEATLIVSFVGFISKEEQVTAGARGVKITLSENVQELDEVVVVGYGSMRRGDLTGSVSSIGTEEIQRSMSTSLGQALQGRAAGVYVTQNSGAPGGGISVNIRGLNTITGSNEPLYVIDGVIVDANVMATVNPLDIMSMEVMKDASAAAIYGTRGANGVILITTNRGQAGKTKVNYDGYVGVQQLPKQLETLNLREFAEYHNLQAIERGWNVRPEFADPSILGEGTNWQKEIFRNALMHNHHLSLSGGNENTTFSISGGYLNQEGIGLGSSYERLSVRMNIDTKVTKWLKMGTNAYIARTQQVNTIDNAGIIGTAIAQLPEVPARNPDGSWGSQQANIYGMYFSNPVAEALMRENYNKGTQLNLNVFADVSFLPTLTYRVEANTNINYGTEYFFQPSHDFGYHVQHSRASRRANNGSSMTFRSYLTYNKQFDKHSVTAMMGHEAQQGSWENLSGERQNFVFNTIHELDAGDARTATNGSNRGSWAVESFYGRLNYSYDSRYMLTATLRNDGSSSFGRNNRRATFPSAAIAWRINNETFMSHITDINNLRLRVSWGLVGNQSGGGYAYGVTMASSPTIWGPGFYPNNFANPDLKWEQTSSINIGMDLSVLKNRVELIVEYYEKYINNLLMQATLPAYISGIIESPWVNVGEMTNKGMDFTLNTVNIDQSGGLYWKTGLTASYSRNKVTRLYTEESVILGGNTTLTQTGQPIGQFYGYKIIGMFKEAADFYHADGTPVARPVMPGSNPPRPTAIEPNGIWVGDFIFADLDNNGPEGKPDGVIDEKDRTFIGNPEPKFVFGINNYFAYKGFDLNIFINGVYGNKLYNQLRRDYSHPNRNSGMLKEVTQMARIGLIDPNGERNDINNVHVINRDAKLQRVAGTEANANDRFSDRFIEDGTYLRIKNVAIGYTFPRELIQRFQIEGLRLYANVQNLHTFTKYKGYDPEVGQWSIIQRGIDNGRYPSQRIFTIGLNITL